MKAKNTKERKREEKERKEKEPVWLIFQRPDLADGNRNPAKFARYLRCASRALPAGRLKPDTGRNTGTLTHQLHVRCMHAHAHSMPSSHYSQHLLSPSQ